jgi:hypothetical protein
VGHTTSFDKRKTAHKNNCSNEKDKKYNLKLYQMIRENGGWDTFKMIEVEKYPCNDRREAERRENEVMKELKANMNTYSSFRTEEEITEYKKEKSKEYYKANKEKIQEKVKEYRENNKPQIQEKKKEYYIKNKPKLQEQKKEHYEENKERIKEQSKKHHESKKERINAKVTCECGRLVMNRH